MAIKAIYEKQDEIPEQYRDLFSERSGKWELTGVEGVKTQGDVDRIQEALRKEKSDHKVARDRLSAFGDMEPDKVREQLDSIEELKLRAEKGSLSDEKLEELVNARMARKLAPLERELVTTKGALEKEKARAGELEGTIRRGTIERSLREAATAAKMVPEAIEDMVLLGERVFDVAEDGVVTVREGSGYPLGLRAGEWLKEMQEKRPHWWPPSQGGGAGGSGGGGAGGGSNPWSPDAWNVTAQGAYIRAHGEEKAARLAEQAGSRLGAIAPTVRRQAAA